MNIRRATSSWVLADMQRVLDRARCQQDLEELLAIVGWLWSLDPGTWKRVADYAAHLYDLQTEVTVQKVTLAMEAAGVTHGDD